ncbi:MAG: hypothetical protein C4527_12205 [Candidatus Omnitrophota bacterium]|jgi:hypothetical protein|nr:MAG: hypothetical protein C4527_12205 [Candidatus Omnitrophota bacterium]
MNTVLGFVITLLIGFVGSRLTLFRSDLSLGMQNVMLAGTEFLFVGMILGPHVSNVLTETALKQLAPILSLALGWIGLLVGLQFERQIIRRIPASAWKIGLTISLIVFFCVFLTLYIARYFFLHAVAGSLNEDESLFVYPQLGKISFCFILGWAATSSTYTALALIKRSANARGEAIKTLQLLTDIRTPTAIIGMGIWYCLFHVSNVANIHRFPPAGIITTDPQTPSAKTAVLWTDMGLPEQIFIPPIMNGLTWLLFSLLLGVTLGWILHYLTSQRMQHKELLLALTGSVIFSSGLATYLQLSPLFVNFVMGATLSNLPNFTRGRISNLMIEQEKSFFVVFMILVGAMWPVIMPIVIVLTILYCLSRSFGLFFGMRLANAWFLKSQEPYVNQLGLAMIPQGGVAIALVVDYILIYPSRHADLVLGIVILSVLLNQLFGPALLTNVLQKSGDITSPQAESGNHR